MHFLFSWKSGDRFFSKLVIEKENIFEAEINLGGPRLEGGAL